VPVALLGLVFFVAAGKALLKTVHFESTSEAVYTAWVYYPVFFGFGAPALLAGIGAVVLLFKRWTTRTRIVVVAVVALAAVIGPVLGLHEYDVRKHIGSTLVRAVDAVAAPAGAVELPRPPLVDNSDTFGDLPEPQAQRRWQVSGHTRQDVCAAIQEMTARNSAWRPVPGEPCAVIQMRGRYYLEIYPGLDSNAANSNWVVVAVAGPRDN
jgi:hypothetical protein